ncbi:sensor domain-containing diguanylate cyclase [Acidithiobacillus sulfurivorans]|uniref:Sensor domain-containing diguanylate cyclase n=1 Tax=Acidithiobacillus sulfurivorans TaxID=1958756 RepID=A0ABS6A0D4_9PROT|nr:sensor domain-containing diguanylate cyclase [Acidithiobacillus sulfurivorans]MBU2760915.1 sensor domain-containing diguanylate cyclase [Acidithiobacillus sulfurivorans]
MHRTKQLLSTIQSSPVFLLHLFFIGMAVLFIALWGWRVEDLRASLHKEFRFRGEIALRSIADQLAGALDGHFHDLTFFRRSFLELDQNPLLLTPEKKAAMIAFQSTHRGIAAINLLDAQANKIIWSSEGQLPTPLLKATEFTQLKRNPDYLVGRPVVLLPGKIWVMPIREHLLNHQGRVAGYIGSPFRLSFLKNIHTPADMDILITGAGHVPVAFWKSGTWQLPALQDHWTGHYLRVEVPGYPWAAYARWSPSEFAHNFWRQNIWQSVPFVVILLFLLILDRLSVRFLRQLLDLRQYQQAALMMQQSLLVQAEPKAMYARLMQTIVRETNAVAAFVFVPDQLTESLQISVLEADQKDLRESLLAWITALNPKDLRNGSFLPERVFCSGQAEEIRFLDEVMETSPVMERRPQLRRIRSMIAYPIILQDAAQVEAVLVVAHAETKHFSQALKALIGQLASSVGLALTLWKRHNALADAEAEIRQVAYYDSLTGLANRRLLNERLEEGLASASQNSQSIALGILDVDDFKKVNDEYGHNAGDTLLVIIARRLEEALRTSDCVARWGGDEFVLLFEGLEKRQVLEDVLLRLERALESPAKLAQGVVLPVRVSLGVCFCKDAGLIENQDAMLRCADQALYAIKAKKLERSRFWMIYDADLQLQPESEALGDTATQ